MRPDFLVHGWPVELGQFAAPEPYSDAFWATYLAPPKRRPFWRRREFAYLLIFAAVLVAAIVWAGGKS